MIRFRGMSSLAVIAVVGLLGSPNMRLAIADDPPDTPETLSLETLAAWQSLIEPSDQDLAYLDVGWETTIGNGVQRAVREHKPLMIYVMNGHPLGCT